LFKNNNKISISNKKLKANNNTFAIGKKEGIIKPITNNTMMLAKR
jgi:hypothetical protein